MDGIQTVDDLGKLVKAKYPGVYDSLPDRDLGVKVKAKYPQYSQFADVPGAPKPSLPTALQGAPAPEKPKSQESSGYFSTIARDVSSIPGAASYAIRNPGQAFKGGVERSKQSLLSAADALRSGEYEKASDYVVNAIPGLGPMAVSIKEDIDSGNFSRALARITELGVAEKSGDAYGALKPYAKAALKSGVVGDVAKGTAKSVGGYALAKTGPLFKKFGGYELAKSGLGDLKTASGKIFDIVDQIQKQKKPVSAPATSRNPAWKNLPTAAEEEAEFVGPLPKPQLPSNRTPGPAPVKANAAPTPRPEPAWKNLPETSEEAPEQSVLPAPKLPSGRTPGPKSPTPTPERTPIWKTNQSATSPSSPSSPGQSALPAPELPSKSSTKAVAKDTPRQHTPATEDEHAFEKPEGAYVAKERYVKANRTVKARALARYLRSEKISLEDARLKDPSFWSHAAQEAGVNAPSPDTIQQSLEEFVKMTTSK